MKTLVIAEKPSVARDIARVLGGAAKKKTERWRETSISLPGRSATW